MIGPWHGQLLTKARCCSETACGSLCDWVELWPVASLSAERYKCIGGTVFLPSIGVFVVQRKGKKGTGCLGCTAVAKREKPWEEQKWLYDALIHA